ncbi:hypothetical protein Pmani_021322 [Petrolisthes manimaculis]|uniref:Uncharacterized protein n=1 Tax=Petrolisthes manimaculis TaxID=1843537 RepID=A0AAE1PEF3_9EUCA|nr:hypothetical protein Pmani_021322 [Petrolisthes manimaculis]
MIFSGGIHTRPAQPLPKDLEEWVEGAGSDGFIFFSLGSAVKPSSMPEELRKEAARRSVIMKDQPQDAKELTVFWVEYVMRHNGASHLRCPAVDMTWLVCHI